MIYYKTLILLLTQSVLCSSKEPNFVIFLTDDQDAVLDGMNPMKNVQRFIANEGTTFVNSYVTSPICCPSRASILTGLHVHNHLTLNNSIDGGCYGRSWRKQETRTFANSLKNAGYNTFYAGKYLNEYGTKEAGGPERVPPGWTEWYGLVGNSVYYNYTLSNNGVPTFSGDLYLTDIIRDLGISYIENQTESQPFLMMLAPPAPHQPFTPAPRHRGVFNNTTMPRHPNFNIASSDKHWLVRMPPSPLPEEMIPELEQVYRSRWESLLAVDEMVADIIEALDMKSLLDDTYIIYTSDNGYHIGQFSQVYDKRQPYETDIKVPLVIRGPTVRKNCTDRQPVSSIDLAPTIMKLAGLNPPASLDGRPITFEAQEVADRYMLIEYYGEGHDGTVDPTCPWAYDSHHLAECYPTYACKCQDSTNNTYGCLRHITDNVNIKYCGFADDENFLEMYDLATDPYEMRNIVNQLLPSFRHWYKLTLAELLLCKGYRNCNNPLENPKIFG